MMSVAIVLVVVEVLWLVGYTLDLYFNGER